MMAFLPAVLLGAAALLLGGCRMSGTESSEAEEPPNVVLIMADDLGAEALGSYGSTSYNTPHLDSLARAGIRFANAYATPLCTPTRIQIMTGQYPFRNGWRGGIWTKPEDEQYFDPDTYNIGRMMQEAGYATATAGKWQLARFQDRPQHPQKLGFNESALWTWRYARDLPEGVRMEGENKPSRFWSPGIWKNGELMQETGGKFGPDVYTDFLIDFMRRHQGESFFVYFPMALTHWPFVPVPGMDGDKDGTREGPAAQKNFAAMVGYMDRLVGRITRALEEMGERENTLILFTGDNGTASEIRSRLGEKVIRGGKHELTEAGTRVPLIASWPGTTPEGTVSEDLIDLSDILPTLADVAGARVPGGITIDGRSFLPQLEGRAGNPRKWVYVQQGEDWFIRGKTWRLRKDGELADMTNRYEPRIISKNPDPKAAEAKRRLQKWVTTLRSTQ